MERWQELAKLEGLISEGTGRALATIAASVAPPLAILEIGSWRGKSTCYLAEGARLGKGAHVYAVDAWDLPGNIDGWLHHTDPMNRQTFFRQLAAMGLADYVTAIHDFSVFAARTWTGPQIGFLFIDGDHSYDAVATDFHSWHPHIAPGGRVAFDDYGTKNSGVKRLVDEIGFPIEYPVPTVAVAQL